MAETGRRLAYSSTAARTMLLAAAKSGILYLTQTGIGGTLDHPPTSRRVAALLKHAYWN